MIGRIASLSRLRNSTDGNPRFSVRIETPDRSDATMTTAPDSAVNSVITNSKYAYPALLRFRFHAGQIVGIEPVGGPQ